MTGTMLDEIIRDLSDDTKPIASILLRLKVLMADIDQPRLVEFVNFELNGYPPDTELPTYRIVGGQVRGNVATIAWRMHDHQLPTLHLTDEQREMWERVSIRESLAALSELLASDNKLLAKAIPMEFNPFLERALDNGVRIDTAWTAIGRASLANIGAQVRSRLLDFLLEIRSVVGKGASDEMIKEGVETFDIKSAFHGAIFGDNATINLGHNNELNVTNTSVKRVEQVYQELEKAGVPKGEIVELQRAITEDGGKPNMGGATGKWYAKLLGKIGSGTLKIGTDVATTVIIDLLTKAAGLK